MIQKLAADGYLLIPRVFSTAESKAVGAQLDAALQKASADGEAVRQKGGQVYAARNVLSLFPPACSLWRRPLLLDLLDEVLGPAYGLVRGLFFDKPPERTWSLAWHRDQTIAVIDNSLPSQIFSKPTRKAGVPHVEAAADFMQGMLTLRIHLDEANRENGALQVRPGSHRPGEQADSESSVLVSAQAGDVLAMRPLLVHASGESKSPRRRRVLHLEFAPSIQLPDGYQWHQFVPSQ